MGGMVRIALLMLALVFGVHHTALAATAPAHVDHGVVCTTCETGPSDAHDLGMGASTVGGLIGACLALLAAAVGIPSLRRRLARRPIDASGARRGVRRPPRPAPSPGVRAPSLPDLCVRRC